MKCVQKGTMILYLDQSLSKEQTARVRSHLKSCPGCAARLKELESGKKEVLKKMALLEPATIPAVPAEPSMTAGKTGRLKPLPAPRRLLLKAAVLALTGVLLAWFILSLPRPPDPGAAPGESGPGELKSQFHIHSITMEQKRAQTYIIKEKDTKTTFIWVEKKRNGG
jgi:anti-sigma factor RsiW